MVREKTRTEHRGYVKVHGVIALLSPAAPPSPIQWCVRGGDRLDAKEDTIPGAAQGKTGDDLEAARLLEDRWKATKPMASEERNVGSSHSDRRQTCNERQFVARWSRTAILQRRR